MTNYEQEKKLAALTALAYVEDKMIIGSGSTASHFIQLLGEKVVDGADEFDPYLRLIKGGGGYLLKEKLVASCSARTVIITDSRKQASVLGRTNALPIEVIPLMWSQIAKKLRDLGGEAKLRTLGTPPAPYWSENGNYILDCKFASIDQPERLADELSRMNGIVEHGLFIGIADEVIMGDKEGTRCFRVGSK